MAVTFQREGRGHCGCGPRAGQVNGRHRWHHPPRWGHRSRHRHFWGCLLSGLQAEPFKASGSRPPSGSAWPVVNQASFETGQPHEGRGGRGTRLNPRSFDGHTGRRHGMDAQARRSRAVVRIAGFQNHVLRFAVEGEPQRASLAAHGAALGLIDPDRGATDQTALQPCVARAARLAPSVAMSVLKTRGVKLRLAAALMKGLFMSFSPGCGRWPLSMAGLSAASGRAVLKRRLIVAKPNVAKPNVAKPEFPRAIYSRAASSAAARQDDFAREATCWTR